MWPGSEPVSLTLKSVISAVNRTTPWGPHVAGRGSCHWTLSLEMWEQFHGWLLKAQTSQWAAPRWAHRQGWWQLCALRCERGWTGGLGLARTQRCGCLGGPAASQWAGGWEAPQGGNSLAGRAGLAPGHWWHSLADLFSCLSTVPTNPHKA